MRSMNICITSGIRRLILTAVSGKARIYLSVLWPVKKGLGSMRTSTQGPRTTDHTAGRVDLEIFLSKRRQNSGRKEAESNHCICMVKKIKIKKKTTIEKVSFCTFGLEVLVYITNVCHLVQIKSVM